MSNNWDLTEAQMGDPNKESIYNVLLQNLIKGVGDSITETFASDANRTPTPATVLAAYRINVTSGVSLTATRDLILPLKKKTWVIKNATTGGQSIRIIGSSGTGITIPNGTTLEVVCDGTNFVQLRPGDALLAYKTADQTAIGTAFADVTELGFAVEANKAYAFEYFLVCTSDATTTGIDVAVNGPSSPTALYYEQLYWTSTTVQAIAEATAYDNNTASTASNGATARIFRVWGILRNGANAGTLIPRAKREAVGSGPSVLAGSYGKLTRLN